MESNRKQIKGWQNYQQDIQIEHHFCLHEMCKIEEFILKFAACMTGSKDYSIKNNKYIVTTLSQRSCLFDDTHLGMEMKYLYAQTMKVT